MFIRIAFIASVWLANIACSADGQPDDAAHVSQVLRDKCLDCHSGGTPEGNLSLEEIPFSIGTSRVLAGNWSKVLDVVASAKMPPAEAPQLEDEERRTLVQQIEQALRVYSTEAKRAQGLPRKMTRFEYQHTMTDLLGIDMDFADGLPDDPISPDGFTNDSEQQELAPVHLEAYLNSARRGMQRVITSQPRPIQYHHAFSEPNVSKWKGDVHFSSQLGRQQQYLAKIDSEYPEHGQFLLRVTFSAELRPNSGFPLLEVAVGYRPDTQILFREFPLIEVSSPGEKTIELRGWIEDFPLPVRGQGKFPGLVIRIRNAYDDGSPLPKGVKDKDNRFTYPAEPGLPLLNIRQVEFHGPVFETWPPKHQQAILLETTGESSPRRAEVRRVIAKFAQRAYRRPLHKREVNSLLRFYDTAREEFPTYEEAIRETLAYVLIQPEFLYLGFPAPELRDAASPYQDNWKLASQLSYFLWSTMPDERLMDLASANLLQDPKILSAEVDRMLRSEKSSAFVNQFCDQWLALNTIENVSVDQLVYPEFKPDLKAAMVNESRAFFAELLRSNLDAMQFLDAEFVMVNESLARHYGLNDVFGNQFRRVELPESSHRGGLLGQAGILLAGSTGSDSHAVRRAVWIRDRLLNDPPAPPPANVPALTSTDPDFDLLPMREKLQVHRSDPSCAKCHRDLDPWGIALENFDAVGHWRDEIRRKQGDTWIAFPVMAADSFSNGFSVDGPEAIRQYLVSEFSDEFARSLLSRMLTYALGRPLDVADRAALQEMEREFASRDYRLRDLVQLVVASDLFQENLSESTR
ncbi:MAG: DUF1592 domain-containing protein [Planctomycetales bacterium]|nr:DUF1592 domain-containing protein [Planctomycetales bacterium]